MITPLLILLAIVAVKMYDYRRIEFQFGYCYIALLNDVCVQLGLPATGRILLGERALASLGRFPSVPSLLKFLTELLPYAQRVEVASLFHVGGMTLHYPGRRRMMLPDFVEYYTCFKSYSVGSLTVQPGKLMQDLGVSPSDVTTSALKAVVPMEAATNLVAATIAGEVDKCARIHKSDRHVRIPFRPTRVLQRVIETSYDHYNIEFAGGMTQHAYAAASRILEVEEMLHKLNYSNNKPPRRFDAHIIDVGGNWMSHLDKGRKYIHCDCPILGANDARRAADRLTRLRMRHGATLNQVRILKNAADKVQYYDRSCPMFCMNKGGACTVSAPACMFVHSVYDMTGRDIADAMDSHQSYIGYGTFIFNPDILASMDLDTAGDIPVYDARWKIEMHNKVKYIRFSFRDDSSYHYVHRLDDYLELVCKSHIVSSRGVTYMVEMLNNVNSTQFFRLTRIDITTCFPEQIHHSWWLPVDDAVNVTYYVLDDAAFKFGYRRLLKRNMIVSGSFLTPLMQYACRASESKFTVSDIYGFACSLASRVVINGNVVVARNADFAKDTDFRLLDLVQFVYIRTFETKYSSGIVLQKIMQEIKKERLRSEGGFLMTLWDAAKTKILGKMENWSNSLCNFFLGALVKRQYGLEYGVIDREITFSSLIHVRKTVLARREGVTHNELDAVADVTGVYFSEKAVMDDLLGGKKSDVLCGTGRNSCLENHKEFVQVGVPGDGDCQFHAIALASRRWLDGKAVRTFFAGLPGAPNCLLKGEWGDDESLAFISAKAGMRFCVHMTGTAAQYEHFRTFGDHGQVYHLSYNGSHYDALLQLSEIEPMTPVGPATVETSEGGPPHSVLDYLHRKLLGQDVAQYLREGDDPAVRSALEFRLRMLNLFARNADKMPKILRTNVSYEELFKSLGAGKFKIACGKRVYMHVFDKPLYHRTERVGADLEHEEAFPGMSGTEQEKSERLYMKDFVSVARDIAHMCVKQPANKTITSATPLPTVVEAPAQDTQVQTGSAQSTQAPVPVVVAQPVVQDTQSEARTDSTPSEPRHSRPVSRATARSRSGSVTSVTSESSSVTVVTTTGESVREIRTVLATNAVSDVITAERSYYPDLPSSCVDRQHARVLDILTQSCVYGETCLDLSNGQGGSAIALAGLFQRVYAVHDTAQQHQQALLPQITHLQLTESNSIETTEFVSALCDRVTSVELLLYDYQTEVESIPLEDTVLPKISVVASIATRLVKTGGALILKCYDLLNTATRSVIKALAAHFETVEYLYSEHAPPFTGAVFLVFKQRRDLLQMDITVQTRAVREKMRGLSSKSLGQLRKLTEDVYAVVARSIAGGGTKRMPTVAKPGKQCNDPNELHKRDQVIAICPETYQFCCTDDIGVRESVLPPPGLGIVAIRGKPFKVDKRQHLMVIHFRNTDELLSYIQKFFVSMNVRVAVVGGSKGDFPAVSEHLYIVHRDNRQITTTHACAAGGGLEWYWSQTNAYKQYWDKADGEYEVDFSIPPRRETFCRNAVRECREQWYISLKNVGQKYGSFYKWHIDNIASVPPEDVRGIKKLCQDSGEDFGIIKNGEFIVRPMDIEFYEKAYDGERFVDLTYPDNDPMCPRADHVGYLLVGKSSRLMQGASMLEATRDFDPYGTYIPPIALRNGVPGCGKTKYIIDNAEQADYILTTTRENKQDIVSRCPTMRSRVRTVHSVIINSKTVENTSVRRLFIDEALMSHAGELLIAITILRPESVEMSGDVNQIPFINRAAAIIMKFDDAARICDSITHASVSYRVPMDVAALFSSSYEQGFTTNNKIESSMKWVEVTGYNELPKADPVLVFKQAEKAMLRLEGYDVSTVHEYQGKQSQKISLYRHSTIPSDQIYMSDPHILVALSRHTQSLVYYTRLKDKVCDVIDKAVGELEKVQQRSMSGGGPSCAMIMNTNYAGPKYTKILEYGLAYDVPRYRLFKSVASILRPRHTRIRLNNVTPHVEILQQWYDTILPTISTADRTFDNHMIHNDPLSVSIAGKVTLDLSKLKYDGRKFDNKRPVLRTGIGLERIRSQRESLLAYIKRNDAVPIPLEPVDPTYVVNLMMEKFQGYFDPERLEGVLGVPLTLNSESMTKWALAQDKSIDTTVDQYLHEQDLSRYEFMIKPRPKPDLTKLANSTYAALQTIAYQPGKINQFLCPLIKDMKERILFCLCDRFKIFSDVTIEEFAAKVTDLFPDGFDPNSLIYEFDISKFDKSQNEIALMLDAAIMRMFGMNEEIVQLWISGHTATTLVDYKGGLKAEVTYQRKSGDPFTFLGNTLFLMSCLAVIVPLEQIEFAAFGGDDQIIVTKTDIGLSSVQYLENVFNLEAKLFVRKYPYFCSKFLLHAGDRWYFLPDLLKLVTKLGRHDLRNDAHIEEYRVSLNDLLQVYRDKTVFPVFNQAFNERYPSPIVDHTYIIEVVLALCERELSFRSLFYSRPDDIVCRDPQRPKFKGE